MASLLLCLESMVSNTLDVFVLLGVVESSINCFRGALQVSLLAGPVCCLPDSDADREGHCWSARVL